MRKALGARLLRACAEALSLPEPEDEGQVKAQLLQIQDAIRGMQQLESLGSSGASNDVIDLMKKRNRLRDLLKALA